MLQLTLTTAGIEWIASRVALNTPTPLDRVVFYDGRRVITASTVESDLGAAGKTFTLINRETGADGEFVVSVLDSSADAYEYDTVALYSGTVLIGARSQINMLAKSAARNLKAEIGYMLSQVSAGATYSVTGVSRATQAAHGTVRLMNAAEIADPTLATAAVPTGANVESMIGALSDADAFQRFTADGTYTKPDGARFVYVECIGGGASGEAQRDALTGAIYGGTSGYIARQLYAAAEVPASVPIQVGAGGAAGTSAGAKVEHVDGGESIFNAASVRLRGFGGNSAFIMRDNTRTVEDRVNAIANRLLRGNDSDWLGSGGWMTSSRSYKGQLTEYVNNPNQGTSGSINGSDGTDSPWGKGSGGAAGFYGNTASVGGDGGVPGGGGGAGRTRGGDGGRGEVRVWTFK